MLEELEERERQREIEATIRRARMREALTHSPAGTAGLGGNHHASSLPSAHADSHRLAEKTGDGRGGGQRRGARTRREGGNGASALQLSVRIDETGAREALCTEGEEGAGEEDGEDGEDEDEEEEEEKEKEEDRLAAREGGRWAEGKRGEGGRWAEGERRLLRSSSLSLDLRHGTVADVEDVVEQAMVVAKTAAAAAGDGAAVAAEEEEFALAAGLQREKLGIVV